MLIFKETKITQYLFSGNLVCINLSKSGGGKCRKYGEIFIYVLNPYPANVENMVS